MDIDGELWEGSEKFIARCQICGADGLKRNMTALYVKERRSAIRVLCHLCPTCVVKLADYLAVEIG